MPLFGFNNGAHFFGSPTVLPEHVREHFTSAESNQLDEARLDASQPGTVQVPAAHKSGFWSNLRGFVTLWVLYDTENLLWVVMAVALYNLAPFPAFDSEENRVGIYASPLNSIFFWNRFPVWFWTQITYVGIFHGGVLLWCKRPFATKATSPHSPSSFSSPSSKVKSKKTNAQSSSSSSSPLSFLSSFFTQKMIHNLFYSIIGVAMWTCLENVVCYLWAHEKLPYSGPLWMPSAAAAAAAESSSGKPSSVLVVRNVLIAVFGFSFALFIKDFCFYFAHRLLHFSALYVFTHALHHRNAHPDVFGGLSMHPVELLLYFSTVLVSLLLPPLVMMPLASSLLESCGYYFLTNDASSSATTTTTTNETWKAFLLFAKTLVVPALHPSVLVWIGVHQQISPAGAHSSYEDHWQSDFAHYIHHRFFDCNFATTGTMFLDEWFGSLVESYYAPETATTNRNKSNNTKKMKKKTEKDESEPLYQFGGRYAEVLAKEPEDEKATLVPDYRTLVLQSKDGLFSVYFFAVCVCWAPWLILAVAADNQRRHETQLQWLEKWQRATASFPLLTISRIEHLNFAVAALAALSPIVLAFVLHGRGLGEALKPFTSRPVWETVLHLVAGLALSVLPLFVTMKMAID